MLKTYDCPYCNGTSSIDVRFKKQCFCQYCGKRIRFNDNGDVIRKQDKRSEEEIAKADAAVLALLKQVNREQTKKNDAKSYAGLAAMGAVICLFMALIIFFNLEGMKEEIAIPIGLLSVVGAEILLFVSFFFANKTSGK